MKINGAPCAYQVLGVQHLVDPTAHSCHALLLRTLQWATCRHPRYRWIHQACLRKALSARTGWRKPCGWVVACTRCAISGTDDECSCCSPASFRSPCAVSTRRDFSVQGPPKWRQGPKLWNWRGCAHECAAGICEPSMGQLLPRLCLEWKCIDHVLYCNWLRYFWAVEDDASHRVQLSFAPSITLFYPLLLVCSLSSRNGNEASELMMLLGPSGHCSYSQGIAEWSLMLTWSCWLLHFVFLK